MDKSCEGALLNQDNVPYECMAWYSGYRNNSNDIGRFESSTFLTECRAVIADFSPTLISDRRSLTTSVSLDLSHIRAEMLTLRNDNLSSTKARQA